MDTNTTKRYCVECNNEKDSSYCNFCKKETKNLFKVEIFEQAKIHESLGITHKRPEVKGFLKKIFQGYQASGDTNKHSDGVDRQMIIDRENDQYDEVVKDNKTGKITRECHEKLSEHVGRGDAKNKK